MSSFQFSFEAIGTQWTIDVNDLPLDSKQALLNKIKTRIELFDRTYSRFRVDSTLMQISVAGGERTLPEDAESLFSLYFDLYKITNGAFTPLIGDVLEATGYDASYSLRIRKPQKPPQWEDVIDYNHPQLILKKSATLDFGAGGKGYLVDIVSSILTSEGSRSYCVDAGGDIFQKGDNELKIGLENPQNTKQVIGVATIKNQSICASAGNRRQWGDYHHIIDPNSLTSPKNILATWVVADTGLVADALATCLFLVSPDTLTPHYKFEYLIMNADATVAKSPHFEAELFYTK